jgi:hypothetical protein
MFGEKIFLALVKKLEGSMSEDKYAVIYSSSYYQEGDERSRTNPGHGYPGGSVSYETLTKFNNLDELKRWIQFSGRNRKFQAIKYHDLTVSTEIVVDVQ